MKLNALNIETIEELHQTFESLEKNYILALYFDW
jgi:enoyl-CoA hydratase/carnithine racemase